MSHATPASARDVDATPAQVLDEAHESLRLRTVTPGLDRLRDRLAQMRQRLSAEAWTNAIEQAREHPVRDILHQDPFMLRCHTKPRGVAGDALALDHVLRSREIPVRPRERIAEIHHFMTQGSLARALRFRRDYLARAVDDCANRSLQAVRVLAAGAGHLREAERMRTLPYGKVARLIACDSDSQNLDTIRRDYGHLPVVTHQGSVRQLVEGKHLFEDLDFVYCAGLLETLPHMSAQGLTRALFSMLKPGGTLLLANFLPALPEAAMMEMFMDWRMALRSEGEIFDLVRPLPAEAVSGWFYSESPESTVGFLSVQRR